MKQILKLKIIPFITPFLFIALFLFSASPIGAASALFEVKNQDIQVGAKFETEFFFNTEDEDINALEGKIVWPENLLELKEIRDGNSIINFWIERPRVSNGEIIFSGIIPGGYLDKKGLILSLVFKSLQAGQGSIEIRDVKALLNDGQGTVVNTATPNLPLVISEQASSSQPIVVELRDTDKPEIFEPLVVSDPAVFNEKYFLVFAAQDKGSGIDRYEVCEGEKKCVAAASPYLLQDQSLRHDIFVKAVDRSGNSRLVVLSPDRVAPWYEKNIIWVIIIILGLSIGSIFLWQRFKSAKSKK